MKLMAISVVAIGTALAILTVPIWGGIALAYFALRGEDWREELRKLQDGEKA